MINTEDNTYIEVPRDVIEGELYLNDIYRHVDEYKSQLESSQFDYDREYEMRYRRMIEALDLEKVKHEKLRREIEERLNEELETIPDSQQSIQILRKLINIVKERISGRHFLPANYKNNPFTTLIFDNPRLQFIFKSLQRFFFVGESQFRVKFTGKVEGLKGRDTTIYAVEDFNIIDDVRLSRRGANGAHDQLQPMKDIMESYKTLTKDFNELDFWFEDGKVTCEKNFPFNDPTVMTVQVKFDILWIHLKDKYA